MNIRRIVFLFLGTVLLVNSALLFYVHRLSRQESARCSGGDKTGWLVYEDEIVSFHYPPQWRFARRRVLASSIVAEFRLWCVPEILPANRSPVFFTISLNYNINRLTGKRYLSMKEFLGERNDFADEITVDGYEAKRLRGPVGSERIVRPYEEVVIILEDASIISLYFNGPHQTDDFETAVTSWFDPLLDTVQFYP